MEKPQTKNDEIKGLYENEQLFQSYEVLQKYKQEKGYIFEKLHSTIEKEYSNATECMRELFDDKENWTLVSSRKDGIKTYLRTSKKRFSLRKKQNKNEEHGGSFSVKMSGTINAAFFNVLSILYEIDLYPNWMFMMKNAQKLKEFSKYKFLCYEAWKCPPGIRDRYVYLHGMGVDLLDTKHKGILLVCYSLDEDEAKLHYDISKAKKFQKKNELRVDIEFSSIFIKPLSRNKTQLILMGEFNLKTPKLPKVLLDLVTKISSPFIFKKISKFACNVENTEYGKRIKENEKVYGDFVKRLESLNFD